MSSNQSSSLGGLFQKKATVAPAGTPAQVSSVDPGQPSSPAVSSTANLQSLFAKPASTDIVQKLQNDAYAETQRALRDIKNVPTFKDPATLGTDFSAYASRVNDAISAAENNYRLNKDEASLKAYQDMLSAYDKYVPSVLDKYRGYAVLASGDLSQASAADAKYMADLAKAKVAELTPVSKKTISEKPTFLELMATQPLTPEQIYGGVEPGTVERRADISDEVKAEIAKYQKIADYYDMLNEWLSDEGNLISRDEWIKNKTNFNDLYEQYKEAKQAEGTWAYAEDRERIQERMKELRPLITAAGNVPERDAAIREYSELNKQLQNYGDIIYAPSEETDELYQQLTNGYGGLLLRMTDQYGDIYNELSKNRIAELEQQWKYTSNTRLVDLINETSAAIGMGMGNNVDWSKVAARDADYGAEYDKVQRELQEWGKKAVRPLELAGDIAYEGITQYITSPLRLLRGVNEFIHELSSDGEMGDAGKAFNNMLSSIIDMNEQAREERAKDTINFSDIENFLTNTAVQAIPMFYDFVLAGAVNAASGAAGAAKAAAAAEKTKALRDAAKGAKLFSKARLASTANTLKRNLVNTATNPMFWSSFAQVAGASYDDARAEGHSAADALNYALVNGVINASIEIGGGVQKMPKTFTEMMDEKTINKILKAAAMSSFEEGMEEVEQGVVERALQKIMLGANNAMFEVGKPFEEAQAIFSLYGALTEYAGGALMSFIPGTVQSVGALMEMGDYKNSVVELNKARLRIPEEFRPDPFVFNSNTSPNDIIRYEAELIPAAIQWAQEVQFEGTKIRSKEAVEYGTNRELDENGNSTIPAQFLSGGANVYTPMVDALRGLGMPVEQGIEQAGLLEKALDGQELTDEEIDKVMLDNKIIGTLLSEMTGLDLTTLMTTDHDLKKFYLKGIANAVNQVRRNQNALRDAGGNLIRGVGETSPLGTGRTAADRSNVTGNKKDWARRILPGRQAAANEANERNQPIDVTDMTSEQVLRLVESRAGISEENPLLDRLSYLQRYAGKDALKSLKMKGGEKAKIWESYDGTAKLSGDQMADFETEYKKYLRSKALTDAEIDAIMTATRDDLELFKQTNGPSIVMTKEQLDAKAQANKEQAAIRAKINDARVEISQNDELYNKLSKLYKQISNNEITNKKGLFDARKARVMLNALVKANQEQLSTNDEVLSEEYANVLGQILDKITEKEQLAKERNEELNRKSREESMPPEEEDRTPPEDTDTNLPAPPEKAEAKTTDERSGENGTGERYVAVAAAEDRPVEGVARGREEGPGRPDSGGEVYNSGLRETGQRSTDTGLTVLRDNLKAKDIHSGGINDGTTFSEVDISNSQDDPVYGRIAQAVSLINGFMEKAGISAHFYVSSSGNGVLRGYNSEGKPAYATAFYNPTDRSVSVVINAKDAQRYSKSVITTILHETYHALDEATGGKITQAIYSALDAEQKKQIDSYGHRFPRYAWYVSQGQDFKREVFADVFGFYDRAVLNVFHDVVLLAVATANPEFDLNAYYNALKQKGVLFPMADDPSFVEEAESTGRDINDWAAESAKNS